MGKFSGVILPEKVLAQLGVDVGDNFSLALDDGRSSSRLI